MAEKDIEKLCLKERVDLSDKKQEQSGLQMRKRVLYLPCWTGRMCCLGSSRVLGGNNLPAARGPQKSAEKKYNNAKQRTKEKIDYLKREVRKTGWGQVELELTEAEEVLLERQKGRPSLLGLEEGFDSDGVGISTVFEIFVHFLFKGGHDHPQGP
uniref:Uncharacterized protein n=1 Tax=Magallana gigas TaxID=29159 RepID=K1PUX3_MAGGI